MREATAALLVAALFTACGSGEQAPAHPPSPTAGAVVVTLPAPSSSAVDPAEIEVRRTLVAALIEGREFERVRVVPNKEGDRVLGVALFGVRQGTPFSDLGFRNGDRVIFFDGHFVTDAEAVPERILRALSASDRMKVDVMRDGKIHELRFVVR